VGARPDPPVNSSAPDKLRLDDEAVALAD